ncbi:caspase domain-containing protein [Xylogone sp. PMI_703]|nr:caspase domain-containing protein [Xylogone sp. PMI_703]
MAEKSNNVPAYWAILIGTNDYPGSSRLEGCVKDVDSIKQYLEQGQTPINIFMLNKSLDSSVMENPSTPGKTLTRENVTETLTRVYENSKEGDFVYIHFSGHGLRSDISGNEESDNAGGDEMLILLDKIKGMRRYPGSDLAKKIKKMVEKGLFVTAVLDCCFSGSIVRGRHQGNIDIRTIDYDSIDEASSEIDVSSSGEIFRGAQMSDWLTNPKGYSILCACGPYETAGEFLYQGEKRGVLTFFLVQALGAMRKSGVELTQQSLYQYLRAKMHVYLPGQTPMLYGNQNFSPLREPPIEPESPSVTVYRRVDTPNSPLCLSAGQVHGVESGDEYDVYTFPFNQLENSQETGEMVATAKVGTVWGLTSDLISSHTTMVGGEVWKAYPRSCVSSRKIRIRLKANVSRSILDMAKQSHYLQFIDETREADHYIFAVDLDKSKHYKIFDSLGKEVKNLPTIPHNNDGCFDDIIHVLQHLAIFKVFEGIENQSSSSLQNYFSITIDTVCIRSHG